jgi:cytoskeleton protein RodZ
MPSVGDEFRIAREARGLSLSDVAEHIHIRSVYLQALEEEDWAAIGAPVYIRGFIRTYARFLGLDPEKAIEAFGETVPSAPPTKQMSSPELVGTQSGRRPSVWLWLAGVVAIALVVYVGYGYSQLKDGKRPAPGPATTGSPVAIVSPAVSASFAAPTVAATAAATAAAAAPHPTRPTVSLHLTELSWLRVSVDGNVVLEGEFPPGTTRDFHGKHVRVLIGNAGGVEVTAPGQPTQTLGSPGQVVERDYVLSGKAE